MKYVKSISLLLIMCIALYACTHSEKKLKNVKQETVSVVSKPLTSTLYYSGIIQPLKTIVITSPTEGVINNLFFHYGDIVKKNQILFSVSSEKFQNDYRTALTQYIKAKTDFVSSESQLSESDFLHKHELISDDEYKAKRTSFYNAKLAMVQAKDALSHILNRLNQKEINLFDLKIEDIDKISEVLNVEDGVQRLEITSPSDGVILLPQKGDTEGELKKVTKGDQVKQGDVLAIIGDLTGLAVHINVSEFNINQLKIGQKVQVTGAAFPNIILEGHISGLNKQAQPSSSGMPVFPIEITIPRLNLKERQIIHIGMSAKVAIELGGNSSVTIPIKAVFEANGQTFVKVLNQKTGKIDSVAVKTGETTLDSVTIESNLVEGDKVVIPR